MLLNRHVQMMLGLVAVAGLVGGHDQVKAATLEVSATVPNSCTVESGALEFGEYQAGESASSVQGSGFFNVECTAPASVQIALDGGLHEGAGSNTRAMKGPGDDFLDYVLFLPPGFSTQWAPDVALPFNLTTGTNEIIVNGVIDSNQAVPSGQYMDTVQITMTFN